MLQFFNVCNHNVFFPNSLRIQYMTEEKNLARFQDRIDAVAIGLQQKQGDIRPLLLTVSLVL